MHVKCCNYWNSGQYGPFFLRMVQTTETAEERKSRQSQPTEFSWGSGPSSPPGSKNPTITRKLELSHRDFPSAGTRTIVQMQYLEWPDLNVPDDPRGILDLVNNLQQEVDSVPVVIPSVNNLGPDEADPDTGVVKQGLDHPPVLLHCSAGVGRTGGFIAIDAILDGVRREVRKKKAITLRSREKRRNRKIHELSQSPYGIDLDVEMSESKSSPLQESMALDDTTSSSIVRTANRPLVLPIHGTPHCSEEPFFHVPVAGWAPEEGSSGSSGERDQSSGDLSSQRDSPSPSEHMDIDSIQSKPRRQKLEQTSHWTSTRQELKEWPTSDYSDRPGNLVRPHVRRMFSDESDVLQPHSDRSSSPGGYRLAFASGSANGSSSGSDLNLAAGVRRSAVTRQSESQMTDTSTGGSRKSSPPALVGSSDSNYRVRGTSIPGTLSSSPAPPPSSTYPSPTPKRSHQRHRKSEEFTGRLSSPLGSSEGSSAGCLSAFGLINQGDTTVASSLPSSRQRTSDEGSASAKDQHSSMASSDRECGIPHEAEGVSRSPPSETIEKPHPRPFDYADPRVMFFDDETPPLLSTFGEPIRRILEDMREQRMSLCQSLRQYVFVHRAIIEGALMIVDEEKEREKEAKFMRKFEDTHVLQKRPSLSEIRHTAGSAEKALSPKDTIPAMQPIRFSSNPLLVAVSSAAPDHSSLGSSPPVRSAKRNASPSELTKEGATIDPELSKQPGAKRRHTEDVKGTPMRAGGLMPPVRATPSSTYSASCHHSSTR
jgi:tyrosine-protein phosphatase 2/3